MARTRAAVIGLGRIASTIDDEIQVYDGHSLPYSHIACFRAVPEVEIVGMSDTWEEQREAARQRWGFDAIYADYRAMLDETRPDIVSVCTSAEPRASILLDIAKGGYGVKAIWAEKPITISLQEADDVVNACNDAGIALAVNCTRRWMNNYTQALRMVNDGLIGDVRMIRRHGKADHRAGAMDLVVLGPHLLDNIRFFAGSEVAWAHAHVTQDGRELTLVDIHEGDEGVGPVAGNGLAAYFVFRNGVTAHLDSYRSDDTDTREQVNWLGLEIHGSAGILSLRLAPLGELYHYPYRLWLPGDRDGAWERITLPDWDLNPEGRPRSVSEKFQLNNRVFVEQLISAIEEDRPVTAVTNGRDARAVLEMIMAIHESQRLRARVDFPLAIQDNPFGDMLDRGQI